MTAHASTRGPSPASVADSQQRQSVRRLSVAGRRHNINPNANRAELIRGHAVLAVATLTTGSAGEDPLVDACAPFETLTVRPVGIGCAGEVVNVMSARGVIPGGSGFPVRWFGGFAVVELPAAGGFLTPPALAGQLCAVLDAGAAGLIADLPAAGVCDSACLDALMRAARRARGWGSWLRLVVRDPGARKVVRLVALDEVMPVHASVTSAVAAAAREAAKVAAGGADLLTVSVSAREGGPPPAARGFDGAGESGDAASVRRPGRACLH